MLPGGASGPRSPGEAGEEGGPRTPCWLGSSWPASSRAPGLAGQGVAAAKGVLASAQGVYQLHRWHQQLLPQLRGRPSLSGLTCPNPHPTPWAALRAQRPALLGLPASRAPEQPQDTPRDPGLLGLSLLSWGCSTFAPSFTPFPQEKPAVARASEGCILTRRSCGEVGVSWPQAPHMKQSTGRAAPPRGPQGWPPSLPRKARRLQRESAL